MENYPRLFIQAGLIYLVAGAALGIAMAVNPALSGGFRFVHIHLNLLGFMTMMIAGVAYHVLPRFNARPVPWPEGVKYHFFLQNIGLIGMVMIYAAGASWRGGDYRALFILFAVLAGAGLFIMVYNLYFVLLPPRDVEKPTRITGEMKVGTVLNQFPEAVPVFLQSSFSALANPAARKTFAKFISIEKACEKHGVDLGEFLRKLNVKLFVKDVAQPKSVSPPSSAEASTGRQEGKEMKRGEACRRETLVGSLIKLYPATKAVFEKHYGEGCFSCPGQTLETVDQTAHMHNVDPQVILADINDVIERN